jgi:uncharacterized cupredoxin-like copper-binding protein
MRRETTRLLPACLATLLLLSLLGGLAVACGGKTSVEPEPEPEPESENIEPGVMTTPPADATIVNVALKEFSITPEQSTVTAGPVYFHAANEGAEAHEMVVIRTDLAPDELPVDDDGRVPEDQVSIVGEIEPFAAGSDASITLDLQPGHYVLICNILEKEESGKLESHYQEGMRTALTVE